MLTRPLSIHCLKVLLKTKGGWFRELSEMIASAQPA